MKLMWLQKSIAVQTWLTEHLTAGLLMAEGYRITALNRRISGVEVDVLARQQEVWVVVEVKFRRGTAVDWENAVSVTQQQRLQRVVAHLAKRHQAPARLDLMLWRPRWPFVTHYKGIYTP